MNSTVELYVGDSRVELSETPEILYTYLADDLNNPTVVKNSFSKTVTLPGSATNSRVFGQYWSLERRTMGTGPDAGVYFNASRKVPFQLYRDGVLYEQGYVRLDEVRLNPTEYDITLFGGLGDFFYNLSTDDNGNELKLSDLTFKIDDLGFEMNADSVISAWASLSSTEQPANNKWKVINFAPCYNGYPDDFDTNKAIINTDGTSLVTEVREDNTEYSARDGFTLAELPDDMTEWDIRDLRSYLQRPVIRMKDIIEACCDPTNNGGYNVELDPEFFNESNPYWNDTWLTLPMVRDMEYNVEEQILTGGTLTPAPTTGDTSGLMYQDLIFSLGEFGSTIPNSIIVKAGLKVPPGGCAYTSHVWFTGSNSNSYHNGWWCMGSLFVQLIALHNDTVIGASRAYNLTSPVEYNGSMWYGDNGDYEGGHKFTPYLNKGITNVYGSFNVSTGGFNRWDGGGDTELTFTITGLQDTVTDLKVVFQWGASRDKLSKFSSNTLFRRNTWDGDVDYRQTFEVPAVGTGIVVKEHNITAYLSASMGRTGTKVTKETLLATEYSPCDYLLSYCKMFGLYFIKDTYSNTVRILTRKNFYYQDDITDITDIVDRSSGVTMTPLTFDSKWVVFRQEADETQYYTNYLNKNGIEYGCRVLDTGYEFNSEKKDLLEDTVIRTCVEGMEKSKWFTSYNNDTVSRPWFASGLHYNLYTLDRQSTYEMTASTTLDGQVLGINEGSGMKYYDAFGRPQFHDADGKPTDGNNVLLFFNGMGSVTRGRSVPLNYMLTDDTASQTFLNNGQPCWLFTNKEYDMTGNRIAYKLNSIPLFGRYHVPADGTVVTDSLDFGTAQELYTPGMVLKEDVNIYSRYWRRYLEDLYSVDNRKLTVRMKLKGQPSIEMLRKFYWYENCIWRINAINDWNIASEATTEVELIKVQDPENYTIGVPVTQVEISLTSDKYIIPASGGKATLTVTVSEGGWRIIAPPEVSIIPSHGTSSPGTAIATFTANPRQSYRNITITAVADNGQTASINIQQDYAGATKLQASPSHIIASYESTRQWVDFIWQNQGSNAVSGYTKDGDWIIVSHNLDWSRGNVQTNINEGNDMRSGSVTWKAQSGISAITAIDQLPESMDMAPSGGSIVLEFQGPVEIISSPSWAQCSVSGGTLTITADESTSTRERRGTIRIANDSSEAEMRLTQKGGGQPVLSGVFPQNVYMLNTGGTQALNIFLHSPWTSTVSQDGAEIWVHNNPQNGDGITTGTLLILPNTGETRTATVTYTETDSGKEYEVNIVQYGEHIVKSFSLNPSALNFPYRGGYTTVKANYPGRAGDTVSVTASDGIIYSSIEWTGDTGQIGIQAPENTGETAVNYEVKFSSLAGDYTLPITVWPPEHADTGGETVKIPEGGGDSSSDVDSNVPWTAVTSDDWITVTPSSGTNGYTDIVISAQPNTSDSPRTGTVEIRSQITDEILATFEVHQDGVTPDPTLSVEPSTITLPASGGTGQITITSNTGWTITGETI